VLRLLPDQGTVAGFEGYLELSAGVPHPLTGLARIDITGASPFLSIPLPPFTLCIKPIVPVIGAGVLACTGGFDLGVSSAQDHNIGVVGVDDFSAEDCDIAGGVLEAPADPHPGVCNGPLGTLASPEPDSGVGAVLIAPDGRFGSQGLPAELSIVEGPCDPQQPGAPILFGFVSGVSRAEIADANNQSGALLEHDEHGENFDCGAWMQENGPGRLVLSIPAVHGATTGDVITVFVLDD
jgi:hypothetical protein